MTAPQPESDSEGKVEELKAIADSEHASLYDQLAVYAAEDVVGSTRMQELAAQHDAAKRRLSAAREQVTRAEDKGSFDKIAEARAHLDAMHAEFDRISHEAMTETQQLHEARLEAANALVQQLKTSRIADLVALKAEFGPPDGKGKSSASTSGDQL
jgi:hypothetical protein